MQGKDETDFKHTWYLSDRESNFWKELSSDKMQEKFPQVKTELNLCRWKD